MHFKYLIFSVLLLLQACNVDLKDDSSAIIQYRVISLDNSVRRPLIQYQFDALESAIKTQNLIPKALKQPGFSWAYIDAILGKGLNRQALISEGYFSGSLTDGELGLVQTTTDKVLPDAIKMPEGSIQVIFEDDVVFPIDLDLSFRMALKAVPSDWDMLFLGCFQSARTGKGKGGVVRGPYFPRSISNPDGFNTQICSSEAIIQIEGSPWMRLTSNCTPGSYSYAVSARSAKKLGDLIDSTKPIDLPIDLLFQDLFGDGQLNAYCLSPELVRPNYGLPSFLR